MNTSAKAVRFDVVTMWMDIADGQTVGVPLAWCPRLLRATPEQRSQYRIGASDSGMHWEELDEGISVDGLLAGQGNLTVRHTIAV